jgi:RNA polymerase sigma factor (sigma-70 family)
MNGMNGMNGAMGQQVDSSQGLTALMSRVAVRDHAAFNQLYELTVCCLLGIAKRMLRDHSWAEEVVQEVYVSIWETAPNYSPLKAQPMTWLMAVARNKALDALRSSRADREHCVRRTAHDDDEDADADLPDHACTSAGPLEQLAQAAHTNQLRACLQCLEPQQRQAITLAFYSGLTHAELAVHLNQPLGTVKAWVRRGLDRIKHCVENPQQCPPARTVQPSGRAVGALPAARPRGLRLPILPNLPNGPSVSRRP